MMQSSTSTALAAAAGDEAIQGRYMAVYGYGNQIAKIIAPTPVRPVVRRPDRDALAGARGPTARHRAVVLPLHPGRDPAVTGRGRLRRRGQ
jgi:predicted NAD/FAD-binding protein